ncbi:hypothetical protein DFQ28_001264 [Apophysomyces sp. BC1034]|nr:hypothetical protein DFQ28_001264 [Apophysomyces sp. BC1034]
MVFGFAFALSAMLWLGAGIYWIESFFFRLDGLRLLLMPIACAATLLPLVFGGVHVLAYAADPLFKVHFMLANVAYGLLAISALHAILMLLVERRLHARRGGAAGRRAGPPERDWLSSWFDTLPPLLTLEKLLRRIRVADARANQRRVVQRATARTGGQVRSQDCVRVRVVGYVRCVAGGSPLARLARAHRVALGAGLVRDAAARVCRQPLRAGGPAASRGGLIGACGSRQGLNRFPFRSPWPAFSSGFS